MYLCIENVQVYMHVRGAYDKFPDFFRMIGFPSHC